MDAAAPRKVEVLYFEGCPNHRRTTALVHDVARALGVPADVEEIRIASPEDAARRRFLGSPSVRVDGVDVEPGARESTAFGLACRTYGGAGVPPRDLLVAAMSAGRSAGAGVGHRSGRGVLAAVPGAAALLLPVAKCPACFPAYGAVMSSLGLGFLLYDRYLLPLATLLVVAALGSLAHRARARRGHGPFWLGLAGAAGALAGKFALASVPMLYAGLGVFTAATVWNAWPRRDATPASCGSCARQEAEAGALRALEES